jgi:hypothetical protein
MSANLRCCLWFDSSFDLLKLIIRLWLVNCFLVSPVFRRTLSNGNLVVFLSKLLHFFLKVLEDTLVRLVLLPKLIVDLFHLLVNSLNKVDC